MKVKGFLQDPAADVSTVGQLLGMHDRVETTALLGCYAYATASGAAAFDLKVGNEFWENVNTRWLFGVDYGRTHPKALEFIRNKPNSQVRIFDGTWIVNQPGFLPRRDFHMKTAFLSNAANSRYAMISGSGNFSANGLAQSVECGVAVFAEDDVRYSKTIRQPHQASEVLWNNATPLEEIFGHYEAAWVDKKIPPAPAVDEPDYNAVEMFWVEAGYVTRNRNEKPGNQIDLPRGMNRFFGFNAPANQAINSVIGPITFVTPIGDGVTRSLRLGNNHMEKITLPFPETHGFGVYDGKVLVFRAEENGHRMWALEELEFEAAFGEKLAGVKVMGSGRRYGYIVE